MSELLELLLGLLFAGIGIWYLLYRRGKPDFWRLAARYPDDAYDWFLSDPCWVVLQPDSPFTALPEPRGDYTGPFWLWVPKFGNRRVTVYGHHALIERSQGRFLETMQRRYGTR